MTDEFLKDLKEIKELLKEIKELLKDSSRCFCIDSVRDINIYNTDKY